jgi:kynurenine formamidase
MTAVRAIKLKGKDADMSPIEAGHLAPYGALPVPRLTPELLSLVKSGEVYSLAVTHYEGIPVPGGMVPYTLSPRVRHGDLTDIRPGSATAEVISMAIHTATHIDALCHIGEHQNEQGQPDPTGTVRLYNGEGSTIAATDVSNNTGIQHLSIAEMPPILTRAVLLDVAGYKNVSVLPDAYVITESDIKGTIAKQGTTITPGTAVLIRTGFYQHLRDGNPAYRDAIAGPGLEAARYLFSLGMTLAGADNMTVEAFPPKDHAVHRFLLVHHGVTHLENLYLEHLAQQQLYTFLLIVTPLRLVGATGSWVHPIAIV